MRSKRLRHTVEIQSRSQSEDSHGQLVDTWAEFWTGRALVEPLIGKELFAAQQQHSEVTFKVRMRHKDGVNGAMRAVYDSRIFNIVSVINVRERGREMVLMCSEGVTDG